MKSLLSKLTVFVLDWLLQKAIQYGKKLYASIKQKQKNKEIVEEHKKAVESGDKDAIEKSGEHLLNGDKP